MFSKLIILLFSSILLSISNLRILLFLGYIYFFSYHVFQLTLTKLLVHLVQQSNVQMLIPNAIKYHMVRF